MQYQSNSPSSVHVQTAYQVATQLAAHESQVSWRAISAFLPFATLLLTGAVFPDFLGVKDPKIVALVGTAFAIAGTAVTFVWWSLARRSRKYNLYWILCARELEGEMGDVNLIRRGELFADGDRVTVDGDEIAFRTLERVRMTTNMNLLYGIFAATFLALVLFDINRIVAAF